jgi:hypothetical protein
MPLGGGQVGPLCPLHLEGVGALTRPVDCLGIRGLILIYKKFEEEEEEERQLFFIILIIICAVILFTVDQIYKLSAKMKLRRVTNVAAGAH